MTTKILIRGGNLINKGAEAMLVTTINQIKKRKKNVKLYVFPLDVERGRYSEYGVNELNYKNTKASILKYFIYNFFSLFHKFILFKKIDVINQIHICRNFDGVLDVSGFNYGDHWGSSSFQGLDIWLNHFNDRNNKFYILMPQAFGPFNNKDFKPYFSNFFINSTFIFARDKQSFKYLEKFSNNSEKINLFPDIVFSFNDDLKLKPKKNSNNIIIGFAPNTHVKTKIDNKFYSGKYFEFAALEIDNILDLNSNIKIRLISTETYPKQLNIKDDSFICKQILKKVKNKNKVIFDDYYSNSYEVLKQVNECDILIGSRYHSIIFALSSNIPVIVVGWSHKYDELMSDFSLKKFIIDIDLIGTGVLNNFVEIIKKNEIALKNSISEVNRENKKHNDSMFDMVVNKINSL